MFSHHVWYIHSFQDLGLLLLRSGNVLFVIMAILLYIKKFRHRARWKQIPFGVRIFAMMWTTYWGMFAFYILVTNESPFGEWFRTLYGTGYLGTLTGLIWCLWYATKTDPKDRIMNLIYENVMKQLEERKLLEDVSTKVRAERVERESGG